MEKHFESTNETLNKIQRDGSWQDREIEENEAREYLQNIGDEWTGYYFRYVMTGFYEHPVTEKNCPIMKMYHTKNNRDKSTYHQNKKCGCSDQRECNDCDLSRCHHYY